MRRTAAALCGVAAGWAGACGDFTLGDAPVGPVDAAPVEAGEAPVDGAERIADGDADGGRQFDCDVLEITPRCPSPDAAAECAAQGCCAGAAAELPDGGGVLLTPAVSSQAGVYWLQDTKLLQREFRLRYDIGIAPQSTVVADGFAFPFLLASRSDARLPDVDNEQGHHLGVLSIDGFCGQAAYLSTYINDPDRGELDWGTFLIPDGERIPVSPIDPPRFLSSAGVRLQIEIEHWLADDDEQTMSCGTPPAGDAEAPDGADAATDASAPSVPTVVLRARLLRCEPACDVEVAVARMRVPRHAQLFGVSAGTGFFGSAQALHRIEICR